MICQFYIVTYITPNMDNNKAKVCNYAQIYYLKTYLEHLQLTILILKHLESYHKKKI